MDISMDTNTPIAPQPASRGRTATAVATWILMVVATVVVLALVATTVGPKVLPYQALVVRSGSMAPTIPTGSIVFYKKRAASKVKVGDIIVFAKPGQADEKVTHRVYQIGNGTNGRYFITKGDANGAVDDWRIPAVGTGWIAAFHVPYVGYALADIQSQTGRLLLLLIPAILLGLITAWELVREKRGGAAA
jgi:signal peptidase I